MTDPKPIRRLEETGDGLRVVVKRVRELYGVCPDGRQNVLTREYPDFFTNTVPKKGGPERVRIGTATHIGDCEGWQIHGANAIYAEVPIEERPLSAAEQAWVGDGLVNRNAESVVEFTIPHPEDLRAAIVDQDLERFDCLEAVVPDHERRHAIVTDLQERLATENVRANQLHPRKGILTDVDPEWRPDDAHNEGKTREHLYDMAKMRNDAHLCDFESIVGYNYAAFRNARYRVLGKHEPDLDPYELCALDVAGYPEWTYCRECGAVGPPAAFLQVDLERVDRTRRVCDRCANLNAGSEHCKTYTPENVAAARDERAQREGGQRNLAGEYE
ncbi:hypothetical protein [Halopiger xanaduensis]|uniref:Uncharacterized protein n=1 Tax=Halopiger xanaduensis (strain DSM 18323 / JCM 14033 / SH-6) TaxID=797210 RepID=F8DEP9_HALXS|nr:hypothetical protein [Halopiger xanaduensis]AEH39486.1 hypothetical protein Halxa_0246 [Halopiger xanaduensis SH-6]